MTGSVSRRRYAEVVKFLKAVIRNEKAPLRTRMQACERLDSIYERHDRLAERRERAEARETEGLQPQQPEASLTAQTPDIAASEEAELDQKTRALFAQLLGESNDGND